MPMTDVEIAESHLERAAEAAVRNGVGSRVEEAHVAAAQAFATLALAEQQRIANLIAILTADNADFFTLLPSRAAEPSMYGSVIGAMLADVQKALGFYEDEAGEDRL